MGFMNKAKDMVRKGGPKQQQPKVANAPRPAGPARPGMPTGKGGPGMRGPKRVF